jgi:drug/metabolite transporter (DMT)-like permease
MSPATAITSAGIPLAVLATTAYNAGLVLEKRALDQLPVIDVRQMVVLIRTLLTAPQWLAGFTLSLCGLAFQVVVLTLEPVTVVQPVLTSGVVVVLVLSRLLLRERLGGGELGCLGVMVVSVVLLTLSGGGPATQAGHDVSSFWMAATAIPSCLAGLLVAASARRAAARKHRPPVIGVSYGIGTGLLYGVAALAIKGLSGILVHNESVGAAAVAINSSPYLYVMAGCIAAGFGFFQTALQRCRASIVVPVSNITGSVYFMTAGTLLFHEHLPSDPGKLTLRLAGILVAGAVLLLLPGQAMTMQSKPQVTGTDAPAAAKRQGHSRRMASEATGPPT